MGLATDSIFIAALSASEDIMEAVGGRIYGTAIPLPDEDAENVNFYFYNSRSTGTVTVRRLKVTRQTVRTK